MKLLILINGKKNKILEKNHLKEDEIREFKIDEKEIAKLRMLIRQVRSGQFDEIFFGCQEIELQRFNFFMKMYIFFSKARKGAILDELGNRDNFSSFKFIFIETPLFIIELIASALVIVYFYIKLPLLKWSLKARS